MYFRILLPAQEFQPESLVLGLVLVSGSLDIFEFQPFTGNSNLETWCRGFLSK